MKNIYIKPFRHNPPPPHLISIFNEMLRALKMILLTFPSKIARDKDRRRQKKKIIWIFINLFFPSRPKGTNEIIWKIR